MVVNDLLDVCVLQTIYGLILLIVIYQDDLLSLCAQQISAGDHAQVLTVLVQNREITMTLACHNFFHIIDAIAVLEGDEVLGLHEMTDRHTLVDETGSSIRVVRSGHDRAAMLLRKLADGHGNCGALADDDAVCLHLDGTQLGLITVAQDNQIML